MKKIFFCILFTFLSTMVYSQQAMNWGQTSMGEQENSEYKDFLASQGMTIIKSPSEFPNDVLGEINYFYTSKIFPSDLDFEAEKTDFGVFFKNSMAFSIAGKKINFNANKIYICSSENGEQQLVFFTNNFIGYLKKYKASNTKSFNILLLVFSQDENLYICY